MINQEKVHLVALTKIDGIGPVTAKKLITHFGNVSEVFRAKPKLLRTIPKIGERLAASICKSDALFAAEKELLFAERNHVQVRSVYEDEYPWLLKNIHDAPLVLFQKGSLDFNEGLNIAIVGTRKPSAYGRNTAERVARYLSERGINVVSGLAYGIDGEAHQAVLEAGGKTTAVLGHGLGTIYPRAHARKALAIGENGALITEFHSEIGPDGRNFPLRNRIISGLCHATVVVEAADRGGALITARMAFQQDREVYAVPGDLTRKTSTGCNQLIRDQIAKIFTHPEDLLADMETMLGRWKIGEDGRIGGNGKTDGDGRDLGKGSFGRNGKAGLGKGVVIGRRQSSLKRDLRGLSGLEKEVMERLCEQEMRVEDIAVLLDKQPSSLYGIVMKLEGKGYVRQAAGGVLASCI